MTIYIVSYSQAEPINAAVRNAGLNNEAQYKELMKLSDAELIVSTTRKVDLLTRQLYVQSNSIDELVKLGQQQEDRLKVYLQYNLSQTKT